MQFLLHTDSAVETQASSGITEVYCVTLAHPIVDWQRYTVSTATDHLRVLK